MAVPFNVYFLDDYHVGDNMFVATLARFIRGAGGTSIVVIDPSDALLLGLEANLAQGRGDDLARTDIVRYSNDERFTEPLRRIVSDVARRVVAVFTEEQVPAVAIHGSDRNLLSRDPNGTLVLGNWSWLLSLAQTGAVPVVSPLCNESCGDVIAYVEPFNLLGAISIKLRRNEDRIVLFGRGKSGTTTLSEGEIGLPDAFGESVEPVVMTYEDLRSAAFQSARSV